MNRRRFLGIVTASTAIGSGCMGMGSAVDLVATNETGTTFTVHLTIGGTITPSGTPPVGRTKTSIGRDVVYFEGTLTLDAEERRELHDVMETEDGPLPTGVSVDVEGGRRVREPVRLGPTAGGTIVTVTIEPDDIDVGTRSASD